MPQPTGNPDLHPGVGDDDRATATTERHRQAIIDAAVAWREANGQDGTGQLWRAVDTYLAAERRHKAPVADPWCVARTPEACLAPACSCEAPGDVQPPTTRVRVRVRVPANGQDAGGWAVYHSGQWTLTTDRTAASTYRDTFHANDALRFAPQRIRLTGVVDGVGDSGEGQRA